MLGAMQCYLVLRKICVYTPFIVGQSFNRSSLFFRGMQKNQHSIDPLKAV